MPRIKLPSINDQVTELQKSISFLESTSDIDAAISHYESAMKMAHSLSLAMDDRRQKIKSIKQIYSSISHTTDDTPTDSH